MIEVLVNQVEGTGLSAEELEKAVILTLSSEGIEDAEISVTLLDDEAIRELNREYLDHDYPTDVLAFALHDEGEPLLGDVYLGLEHARRQAGELELPLAEEMARLAIHGTLHVLGYDHPTGSDRESSELFRKQEAILGSLLGRSA